MSCLPCVPRRSQAKAGVRRLAETAASRAIGAFPAITDVTSAETHTSPATDMLSLRDKKHRGYLGVVHGEDVDEGQR